ncbi:MAG: PASTA domain-containing protein [Gammaproteobacteria bacterium]|nr:PASTA domain-containing protein [Gammaproteobacteria bacterium]
MTSQITLIFITIILLSGCGGGTESTGPAPDPDPDPDPEPRTTVTVPDVRGLLASNADQEIEDAGLSVGAVTREFDPSTEIDRVATQDPAGGERITLGTAVNYEVSRGPRSAPPTTCPPQMIQYFKFEESGPNYADELGGVSATCTRCPMAIPGRIGTGQRFDGSDDGLNVADNDQFDWTLDDEFSIEFWMRSDSVACTRARVIVGRSAPDVRLNQIQAGTRCSNDESFPHFRLEDSAGTGGGNGNFPSADKRFIDGDWHHVVSIRTLDQLHLYIDGVNRDSIPKTDYIRDFITTTELNIGWLNRFQNEFRFKGDLDELALYKRALTDEEILEHFNNGQQGLGYCEVGNGAAQP